MNLKPFQNAEHEFFLLKGQLASNRLTRAEFDAALAKLNVRDEYGRTWRMEPENGAWQIFQDNAWIAADPKAPPAASHAPVKTKTAPASGTRTNPLFIFIALGAAAVLCVCAIAAFGVLNATGVISVNLFRTATPTSIALLATATPTVNSTAKPTPTLGVTNTAASTPESPNETALPTPNFGQTFLAFDADFFADTCPFFEGDNEIRSYSCGLGEYTMLHKQATTRYTYYDVTYEDAVIEAEGYFINGTGKYEYGVVFRATTDGSLYYVFTVTQDGKYNVALYKDEKYTDLIPYTASPLVKSGKEPNHLLVVMRGNKFDFYLNDQFLNSVTDNTIARGVTGLFFYNGDANTQVGFDQFTVSTFTPPPTQPPNVNATGTPENSVAFTDDFASGCNLSEGDNETRAYKCQNGEYLMQHKQDAGRWSVYDAEFGDGIFEADGHFVSGSGTYEYGMVLRALDNPWTFYGFTVTDNGKYSIFLYKDDKYTDLIPYTESAAVKTGKAVNHFRILAQGNQFQFFLNDQYLNTVTDATIGKGSPGFYLTNKEPNVQVAFDNMRVSTFNPGTAIPTAFSIAATNTPLATNIALKPGVYVNNLRFTPRAPKRGEPVTFFVTFLNATGRPQTFKWLVEIWEANTNKKNPYGQADGLQQGIPVGTKELATGDSWKVAGGGPCIPFRARVVYQNDQGQRLPFTRPNGSELWVPFQVCP